MSDLSLLDTHVLLWAVATPHRLAAKVRSLIEEHHYAISVATLWELVNKKEKRDAPVKDPVTWWERYVIRSQTVVLPIRAAHVLYLDRLPWHHRDPYDRILIAQAAVEKMPLVTADEEIRKYGIDTREAASSHETGSAARLREHIFPPATAEAASGTGEEATEAPRSSPGQERATVRKPSSPAPAPPDPDGEAIELITSVWARPDAAHLRKADEMAGGREELVQCLRFMIERNRAFETGELLLCHIYDQCHIPHSEFADWLRRYGKK